MLKPVVIQDVFNRHVKPYQKVAVLVKTYGFGGISRASLRNATYLGKGQYGYEFSYRDVYNHRFVVRIREPQCVRKGSR